MSPSNAILAAAILAIAAASSAQELGGPKVPLSLQLRDRLLDSAESARRSLSPPPLGPEAQSDLARISEHRTTLFDTPERIGRTTGPADFALFYDPSSDADVIRDLRQLVTDHGLSVALHPNDHADVRALHAQMSLDTWPSYVFPNVMLRGAVPVGILPRYLRSPGTTD